jgi:hypothetical protein
LGQVLDAGGFPIDTSGGAGPVGGPFDTTAYNPPDIIGVAPGTSTLPATLTQIGQAGFADAYKILQLLNPVPPGTTMQVGPGGTFITRAAAGQPTPGTVSASGGSLLWLLGIGVLVFVLARNK